MIDSTNLVRRGAHYEASHVDPSTLTMLRTSISGGAKLFRLALSPRGLFRTAGALQTKLTSLAQYEAPLMNQGQTGSCVGHRTAMALAIATNHDGRPLPFVPSPDGIYRDARCIERGRVASGALSDSGCSTVDAITALSTCGIRAIGALPSSDGYTDVNPNEVNREPRLDELEAEANTLTAGEYAIDLSDTAQALIAVQASLLAGFPVWIDATVDSVFETWGEGWSPNVAPLDAMGASDDPSRGGHALVIDEMLVDTSGAITLCGMNSWGPWGAPGLGSSTNKTGHFRVGPNWFGQAVYTATVGKVVA